MQTLSSETSTQQLLIAQSAYDDAKKNPTIVYLMWFFLGIVGGHRFYVGDTGKGVAMVLTLGGFGFWALIDVFFIGRKLDEVNGAIKQRIFAQYGIATPAPQYVIATPAAA